MDENKFTFGEPIELTLEEAFPTASPGVIAELRAKHPAMHAVVTDVDTANGVITLSHERRKIKSLLNWTFRKGSGPHLKVRRSDKS